MEEPNPSKERYFRKGVLNWSTENGRDFLWRESNLSPYNVIVAEILLQRTRAEKVQEIYPKYLKKFPNWESLVEADASDIEETIKPLGIFRKRARGLKDIAETVLQSSEKRWDDLDFLMGLPCVGQYIGRSVLVNCYEKPEPMLDTNMVRVLERYFGPREKADFRHDKNLNDLAKRLVSKKRPREYNWAIMDFAALICKAQEPNCQACPISKLCEAYSKSRGKVRKDYRQ